MRGSASAADMAGGLVVPESSCTAMLSLMGAVLAAVALPSYAAGGYDPPGLDGRAVPYMHAESYMLLNHPIEVQLIVFVDTSAPSFARSVLPQLHGAAKELGESGGGAKGHWFPPRALVVYVDVNDEENGPVLERFGVGSRPEELPLLTVAVMGGGGLEVFRYKGKRASGGSATSGSCASHAIDDHHAAPGGEPAVVTSDAETMTWADYPPPPPPSPNALPIHSSIRLGLQARKPAAAVAVRAAITISVTFTEEGSLGLRFAQNKVPPATH